MRLRFKGAFVTKEKAIEILGLEQNKMIDKRQIKELLDQHPENKTSSQSLKNR